MTSAKPSTKGRMRSLSQPSVVSRSSIRVTSACACSRWSYSARRAVVATLPVLITGSLLFTFCPRSKDWWEHLDQIWNAYEVAD
jgi:hypothetical protein